PVSPLFPYTTLFRSDVVHAVLHLPLVLGCAGPAGVQEEAVVSCHLAIGLTEDRVFDRVLEDGGFQVVDHHLFGNSAEEPEGAAVDRKSTRLNSSHVK